MSALGTTILNVGSALGINLLSPGASGYVITDITGGITIIPDTMEVFDYAYEEKLSDYPIEQGGFNTYNKVKTPRTIKVDMACGGLNLVQQGEQALDQVINSALGTSFSQGMTRAQFLAAMDSMVGSLDLFNITTPDITYSNFNATSVKYNRSQRSGAGIIRASVVFREVIEAETPSYSGSAGSAPYVDSSDVGAANPVGLGTNATLTPNAGQSAWIDAGSYA